NIPPFNPQKLLADSVSGDDQTPTAAPDAEVSFVTCDFIPPPKPAKAVAGAVQPAVCDLNSLLPKVKPSTQLSMDDVLNRVRDVASNANMATSLVAGAGSPITRGLTLSYAAEGNPDTYFGFQPRVVPENVTLLPKTTSQINGGGDWSERL